MDNKKIVKKYFRKYFKAQFFEESDHEFKALLKILNKKDKPVEKRKCPQCKSTDIVMFTADLDLCKDCGKHLDGE